MSLLVHSEDQIIVIVEAAAATCGRASVIAEVGAHRLQVASRKSVSGGDFLRTTSSWSERPDQYPGRTICIGRIVQVEMVQCERTVGPDCGGDGGRSAVSQSATVGSDHDAVVGLIGVEGSYRAIRAGVVDGVGLIGFRATRERVASEQQRWAGIARRTSSGAFGRLEYRVKNGRLRAASCRYRQGNRCRVND